MKKNIFLAVLALVVTRDSIADDSNSSYWDTLVKHPQNFSFPTQVELVVAAEEWIPHIAVTEDPDGVISISGPMANLLDMLARSLNFRYKLVRPPDGGWGIPHPDQSGEWTGMIGMVKRQEADLALGPFGLTASRSQVVSFSSPILIDYYRILVKRETPQPDPWGWRSPFTLSVWGYFGICLLIAAILLWGITSLFYMESTRGRGTRRFGFWEHLWLTYGATISQSLEWLPGSWSGRTLTSLWLIVVLIATKSYSSSLTSLLAVRTVSTPYNYLVDLVADKEVTMVFESATALVEHLQTVQTGIYASIAAEKDRSKFVTPPQLYVAAYEEVRTSKTALLVEDTTCRKVLSDDFTKYGRCDFYIGKERYWPLIFSMIGKKNHPIIKAISTRIDHMVSHDLYYSWLNAELPNATACLFAPSKVIVREPYSITGLWGVFIVLAGGCTTATLSLIGELIYANVVSKTEEK